MATVGRPRSIRGPETSNVRRPPLGAARSSDGGPRSMGPPLLRRPLPDASPRWCSAPKPLCGGAVRARPERWGAAPSGGWPGLVGSVACSAASRRGRWWALLRIGHPGALVGKASWGRCCAARGSQAGLGHERGEMVGLDYRSGPPQVKCPRHVASTHQRPKSYNIIHSPHKHQDHTQSPHFVTAKQSQT